MVHVLAKKFAGETYMHLFSGEPYKYLFAGETHM